MDTSVMGVMDSSSSRRTLWMGQEFVDSDTRKHVQRVVLATVIMAILQVAFVVIGLSKSNLGPRAITGSIINLVLGLILPACGFYGAVHSKTPMMCCFCGTNMVFAIAQFLLFLSLTFAVFRTDELIEASCSDSCQFLGCGAVALHCSCRHDCLTNKEIICCHDMLTFCPQPGMNRVEQISCKDLDMTLTAATVIVGVVMLLFICPGIVLSVFSWWHGMKLWSRLRVGENLVAIQAPSLSREPLARQTEEDEEQEMVNRGAADRTEEPAE